MTIAESINTVLAPYAHKLDTALIAIEPGLAAMAGALLKPILPEGRWLVVADAHTYAAAENQVTGALAAADVEHSTVILEPESGTHLVVTDNAQVERIADALTDGFTAAVAVGSGTVSDIVKTAAFGRGLPYAVIATAPSMTGYTSATTALLSDGVKTTALCRAPIACIMDTDIIAAAPARMIAAGYADIIAKTTGNADWRLSQLLLGTEYSSEAAAVMDRAYSLMDGIAPGLAAGEAKAVAELCGGLILVGAGATVAGTSAPASGAEHLISHYLDMSHYAFGEAQDLHGCQVGVGTVAAAAFYERLLVFDPESIDPQTRASQWPPWSEYLPTLHERFGNLAPSVIPHAEGWYPSADALQTRLHDLKQRWPEIITALSPSLITAAEVTKLLRAAGAPVTFADIGADRERASRTLTDAKDIRNRYTVLHLAAELGVLNEWRDGVVSSL